MDLQEMRKIARMAEAEMRIWAQRERVDLHYVHLLGLLWETNTSLAVWIFYRTDPEVVFYARNGTLDRLQQQFLDTLRSQGYPEEFISQVSFVFDSDENVQHNYGGSYFARLR